MTEYPDFTFMFSPRFNQAAYKYNGYWWCVGQRPMRYDDGKPVPDDRFLAHYPDALIYLPQLQLKDS